MPHSHKFRVGDIMVQLDKSSNTIIEKYKIIYIDEYKIKDIVIYGSLVGDESEFTHQSYSEYLTEDDEDSLFYMEKKDYIDALLRQA